MRRKCLKWISKMQKMLNLTRIHANTLLGFSQQLLVVFGCVFATWIEREKGGKVEGEGMGIVAEGEVLIQAAGLIQN